MWTESTKEELGIADLGMRTGRGVNPQSACRDSQYDGEGLGLVAGSDQTNTTDSCGPLSLPTGGSGPGAGNGRQCNNAYL